MTRIFISHSHSDGHIASDLVDFLMAALTIESKEIRCTSVPGHQLPFGISIGEQLKGDLNKTTGVIALITKDSLRSTWMLFELGSVWATEKLVVPILGPGLNYDNLPGPLKNYPGVRIDDQNPSYRMTDVINQLASNLSIQPETNARRDAKLNRFISAFKKWKPRDDQANIAQLEKSYQSQINHLEQQLEEVKIQNNYLKKQLETFSKSNEIKEPELKSERGINYKRLRYFLSQEKWEDADNETAILMIKAADRECEGCLIIYDIDKISLSRFTYY